MENKKYEFTGETIKAYGRTLRRVRRLRDGEIGGWIEAEKNLSQDGAAWISGAARIFGAARIEKPLDFIHVAGLRYAVTIRNDGFASIGCTTKTIEGWLALQCDEQEELGNTEFSEASAILRPLMEFMLAKSRARKPAPESVVSEGK